MEAKAVTMINIKIIVQPYLLMLEMRLWRAELAGKWKTMSVKRLKSSITLRETAVS